MNLLEQVEILLASEGKIDEELLKRCEQLIKLQRITENTNARKRLEKWTKRLIVWYFTIIALIVIAAAFKFRFYAYGQMYIFYLSDNVLITLLSTTTINIIGIGIILMKGHFPHKDDGKQAEKSISNEI